MEAEVFGSWTIKKGVMSGTFRSVGFSFVRLLLLLLSFSFLFFLFGFLLLQLHSFILSVLDFDFQ